MSTIADLVVRIGADVDNVHKEVGGVTGFVESNMGKIGAAGVVAGAGLEAFARSQAPLNQSLRQTAAAIGVPEQAMRDLALETSNVTFPLDEVIDLMEIGRQRGLDSAGALQDYANFWDTVGDATGESAVELGRAGVALGAVGIAAGDEGRALDAFGYITENTTGTVGDFLTFLERTGPQLNDMGADVDDAAALLGILENEFGMTGRTARQEFRKAVNEADGDMGKMLETLGISEDQFNEYRSAVSGSSDVIERNAAIHAESYTPMQKLEHAAQELMFKFGGLADVAGSLALPLMALGPILKVIMVAKGALIGVAKGLIVSLGMVGKAFLVMSKIILTNPFILVAAAIIALVIIVIKNWDTITKVISKAWAFITGVVSKAASWLLSFLKSVLSFLLNLWNATWGRVISFAATIPGRIMGAISSLLGRLGSFIGSVMTRARNGLVKGFTSMISFVRSIPGRIVRGLGNLGRLLFGAGKAIIQGLINGIKNMVGAVGRAVSGVVKKVRDFLPFSPAAEGPLRDNPPDEAGETISKMLAGGIGSAERDVVRAAEAIARAAAVGGVGPTVRGPESAGYSRGRAPSTGATVAPAATQTITLDVTGADEEMKRLVRKLFRASGLEVDEL